MLSRQNIIHSVSPEKFWDIPGVSYRGETGTYRIFEKMTSAMTQDKLAEMYETEKIKGNPYPVDSVLHFAICNQAYNLNLRNKDKGEAEQLRVAFQRGIQKFPNTLSRVVYSSLEKAKIIHNYNTSDAYSIDAKVVGDMDFIKDVKGKNSLKHLLGKKRVREINNVFQWINNTPGYFWRLGSKPDETDERVIRFKSLFDMLIVNASGYPHDESPAFRVLRVA